MSLWRAQAQIARQGLSGSGITMQIPAFFIDTHVLGIDDDEKSVERAVRQMIEDINPRCSTFLTLRKEP